MKNIRFEMNYKCSFGHSLYVCGNILALGNWDPSKALPMNWKEGHNWDVEILVPLERDQEVDYKYFIAAQNTFQPSEIVWENGPNRTIESEVLTSESSKLLLQKDIWDYREVRLVLRNSLPINQEPYLCGDILNILKNPSPLKMTLLEGIDPLNQTITNYFWTIKLLLHHSISEFEYKYILHDKEKGIFIQNRKVSKVFLRPKLETEISVLEGNHPFQIQTGTLSKTKLTSSEIRSTGSTTSEIYLNNYMKLDSVKYSDFIFNQIASNVFLGASINDKSEVALLKENGVQAIFNLQTDLDIRKHNPNHEEILLQYQQEGIDFIHIPIKEQNSNSLLIGCIQASKIIHELISGSKVVYIHCTYGAFRSVHAFLSYLCLFEKTSTDDAINFIKKKRPIAVPCRELLKQVVEGVVL